MSHVSDVARKFRRALRNETGVHLSLDELRALAGLGALDLVTRAENLELCPPKAEPIDTDSPAPPAASTPSWPSRTEPIPKELAARYIEALRLGE